MKGICAVRKNVSSVTSGPCQNGTHRALQSCYPGAESIGISTGTRHAWANCLATPCGPDKAGSTQCRCPVTSSREQWPAAKRTVLSGVPEKDTKESCSPSVYGSSATPAGPFAGNAVLASGGPTISWVEH